MTEKEYWQRHMRSLAADEPFLIRAEDGFAYTYQDFFGGVQAMAEQVRVVRARQLIVCMENSPALCMLYFACAMENKEIIPLDPQKSPAEIERIRACHPDAETVGVEPGCTLKESLQQAAQLGKSAGRPLDELFAQTDFEKPYLITYTSGSTGLPKGVVHSLRGLVASALSFGKLLGYVQGDTFYHAMPMTYMAGILNTIFLPFLFGCRIVLGRRFSVMEAVPFWKRVAAYRVTCFWMAPAMLRMLLTVDRQRRGRDALAGRKIIFSVGTAPLDARLREDFEQAYGIRLYQSYGLSETLFLTSQCTASPAKDHSVGRLLDGVEMKRLPDGEASFRVPWMFLGYWDGGGTVCRPPEWYDTGDLIDGTPEQLVICGRKKDLIIKGGININPNDIEQCLQSVFGIAQCVVLGVPRRGDEQIVCWTAGAEAAKLERGALNAAIEQHLGHKYRMDALVNLPELPRNLNGKIDKPRLRQEWEMTHP